MKKLLFITWSMSYGYGTEKSLADIINRLNPKEYDISVLPLFKNSKQNILNSNIKILDSLIDYTKENFNEKEDLEYYYSVLASPIKFNKLLPQKYDCVIACNHNAPSYFASYLVNTPKVVWIRGDLSELNYNNFKTSSLEYSNIKQEFNMQKNVFQSFDNIVVISDVVKKELKDYFGITDHVLEIPNSVDIKKIRAMSEENIDVPNKALFTTLGRLDENKNQILLLKAATILKKKRNDFIIYILGDGDKRSELEKYIKENNLEENVKILGFQNNPYPYIKKSTASVLTSLSEGFSLALAESVLLNTPIISSDVGIAKELVTKYNCGILIKYDEEELAKTLELYIEKYYKGIKDYYYVDQIFDIENELSKTIEVIENTIRTNEEKTKFKKLNYPVEEIFYEDLKNYIVKSDIPYILCVKYNQVKYEYLIHKRSNNDKLIIFNNGAIAGGNVKYPIFQRYSWDSILKTSSIFCMDPTMYVADLAAGWGVGKNDDYYLENSSIILKSIVDKMNISLNNTVIYGTSAGGFLSIMMGIYLKGAKVVADNAQFGISNWAFISAVDAVIEYCFNHVSLALKYPERFSVVDAFKKNSYVPPLFIHVNICSKIDNSMQLVPFLEKMEQIKNIDKFNPIKIILHYDEKKGHDGLIQDEALDFIYQLLENNNM